MFMKKYPSISPRSSEFLTNNNLFSIEPGHYVEGEFGIRIENLYVTKVFNKNLKLKKCHISSLRFRFN